MKLAAILRSKMEWLGRPGSTILSSRVRLARSLRGRPYAHRARPAILKGVLDEAFRACKAQALLASAAYVRLDETEALDRQLLLERHLISHHHAAAGPERGVVIGPGERLSVMVNEEDHLRLQSMAPGLALEAAFKDARRLDAGLGERLAYAFDERWGHLAACPTNVGTGMRASCLAHLPGLALSGRLPAALEELTAAGMVVRGMYGEGTRVLGDLFQVSNATSLGATEPEYLRAVERAVARLEAVEKQERERLVSKGRRRLEDLVGRALGVLAHARLVSFDEAIANLSRVRLGAELGLLKSELATIDRFFFESRPAHLQAAAGRALDPEERDERRASLLRAAFA